MQSTGSDHLATSTGAMIGSPHFMSPEQVVGSKSLDQRTDIWSLAIVAFFAVTGQRPFDGETLGAISVAIVASDPPAPSALRPELPVAFDDWFAKATARDASARFASAKEMADALVAIAGGPGVALISTGARGIAQPQRIDDAHTSAPTIDASAPRASRSRVRVTSRSTRPAPRRRRHPRRYAVTARSSRSACWA